MTFTEHLKTLWDTIRATAGLGGILAGALADTAVDVLLGRELPHPKAVHPVDDADALRMRPLRVPRNSRSLENDEVA